jgi:TolA-binding protein
MKRLSPALFSSVILLICLGLIGLRAAVSKDDTEAQALRSRLAMAEKETAEARFRERLALEENRETREVVAKQLPGVLKGVPSDSRSYQIRTVASVVNSTSKHLKIERASSLLERAKEEFRLRNYEESNLRLEALLNSYPDSLHGPEARFLLVEGYFQSKDFEACIEIVEQMIRLYPESELTGFALLRLGKIYEGRDRIEDAAEIYRSVAFNFTQAELKRQAEVSLKAVEL